MSLISNLLPVLLMALSGVGFLGCATGPQMSLSNWEGTELKAVRMVSGGQVVTLPENPPITLKLDAGGKVSGRSAVNRYFGSFTTASDGTIIWNGALGATRMAGPPEAMQLETEYFKTLTATTIIHAGSSALTFKSSDGKELIEFVLP